VELNSEAAMTSMVKLIAPAAPSPMNTSRRWKRSTSRRSSGCTAVIRFLVSAECRYTTCGITVAPMMPAANTTLGEPLKLGTRPPARPRTEPPTAHRS
jgi:hypothetical protein